MYKRKTIGKIQNAIAVFLFIATIISSIFIIKYVYLGSLMTAVEGTTSTWADVANNLDQNSQEGIFITGFVVENLMV
ncbi:MAG: hypothetical protein KKA58_03535 [Nanoarchaeota archaeon]|nr:hypothetical protein [Nanoarchaeota archaeon]